MSKGSFAQAVLVGRMGGPIEVKTIGSKGTRVGNLSIACTRGFGDKAETSWFNVQIFGDRKIDAVAAYTEKGSRIAVIGELAIRKYQKNGENRYATEVTVGFEGTVEILDGIKSGDSGTRASGTSGGGSPAPAAGGWDPNDLDEDVPF